MAGLFGGGGGGRSQQQQAQTVQPPALQPVTPMPVPDPVAQRRAALKADASAAAGKTTRANTIIGDDSLGGG